MRFTEKITFTVGSIACGLLLAACDSGSVSTTTEVSQVSSAESPIPNTSGVRVALSDGGYLYALSASSSSNLSIKKDSEKSNGDKSTLVDKTFFEFDNLSTTTQSKALVDKKIAAVYECSLIEKNCTKISLKADGSNQFFIIQSGYFYALEK